MEFELFGHTSICSNCKFAIYVDDDSENEFFIISSSMLQKLKEISLIEKEVDEFDWKYTYLYAGVEFITHNSDLFAERCPSCHALIFYDEKKNNRKYIDDYLLESGSGLPMLGTPENQSISINYSPQTDFAEMHFEHTPLPKDTNTMCVCGCKFEVNITECDYFVFSFYLLMSATELSDYPEYSFANLPLEKRVPYTLSLSYKAKICKQCKRLYIRGKDYNDDFFESIYTRANYSEKEI